jgi:phenylpropionate dioxygenase-like ring-hydroxylating dioxygenase large terminal subunit
LNEATQAFEEELGELQSVASERGLNLEGRQIRIEDSWDFAWNWKVFYDNAAECYHCPTVHPSFQTGYLVGEDEYMLTYHKHFVHHRSPVRHQGGGNEDRRDWEMLSAWPNWSLGSGEAADTVLVWSFEPLGPHQTRLRTWYCAGDKVSDAQIGAEAEWWRSIVNVEDRTVCETVQRGLEAGAVNDGPLLLKSEHVIQRFQEEMLRALEGGSDDSADL